ncbi:MAG: OadG family protein [Cyclobacteriaceae bacterium]|nr:OadG family protein [Cyclobacteriaceae bacterium]
MISFINWDLILGDGLIITVIGYLIVFIALVLLTLVFNLIPKILKMQISRTPRKKGLPETLNTARKEIPGEVNAAIGTALFMFFNEMHDAEDPVITIKRISKNYTPWSSKIYGVTRGLNRRF